MPGRGMGERLAIDPNRNSILYFGAPSGNGLWRSTDSGVTWAKVTNFPNAGNYVQDPSDTNGYLERQPGRRLGDLRQAHRHRRQRHPDHLRRAWPTRTTPSTAATDGGTTWERVAGQPTGYIAHKGVLDTGDGYLYIATSDTGGPYDGGKGDVWKYNTATGAWTQISPIPSSSADDYFGYSGLTDRPAAPEHPHGRHPDLLVAGRRSSSAAPTAAPPGPGSGTSPATPTARYRYTMDITAVAVADLRRQPAAARGDARSWAG